MSRFFAEDSLRSISPCRQQKKCKTLERHESEVFIDLYKPTFRCLEIAIPQMHGTVTLLHSLLLSISQFLLLSTCTSQKVLSYTKGLSIKLQGRYVDVVRAYRDIELVKKT